MLPTLLNLLRVGSVVFTIWSSCSAASGLGVSAATIDDSVASIFRVEEEAKQDTSMKMETKYSFETLLTFSSGIKNKLSKIPA
jgi:hypothetical protein